MIDADKYSRLAKLQPPNARHRKIWHGPNCSIAVLRSRTIILIAMPKWKPIFHMGYTRSIGPVFSLGHKGNKVSRDKRRKSRMTNSEKCQDSTHGGCERILADRRNSKICIRWQNESQVDVGGKGKICAAL